MHEFVVVVFPDAAMTRRASDAIKKLHWEDRMPIPAASDWDASFPVERINLQQNAAKTFRRKREFDQMREVPFVPKADDLALAMRHLAQSSSASRFTAGAANRRSR